MTNRHAWCRSNFIDKIKSPLSAESSFVIDEVVGWGGDGDGGGGGGGGGEGGGCNNPSTP